MLVCVCVCHCVLVTSARVYVHVCVCVPTQGLKERYERHHRVVYSEEAILSAVALSHKYIADRFLPDKAIDLLDEAGSRVRIQVGESVLCVTHVCFGVLCQLRCIRWVRNSSVDGSLRATCVTRCPRGCMSGETLRNAPDTTGSQDSA